LLLVFTESLPHHQNWGRDRLTIVKIDLILVGRRPLWS